MLKAYESQNRLQITQNKGYLFIVLLKHEFHFTVERNNKL